MNTLEQIKAETATFKAKLDLLLETGEKEFRGGLEALLRAHPEVDHLSVPLNNHEFNDGDATYFSFTWEDLTMVLNDDEEIDGYDGTDEQKQLRQVFVDFFETFDDDALWERLFGDEYESVNFSLSDDKLTY